MANQLAGSSDDKNLLNSWKEIARRLHRDVRTCLRWEKNFGLPIHRIDPDSEKSRVFAYKNELDEWLSQDRTSRSASHGDSRRLSRRVLLLSFVLICIGAAAVLFFSVIRPGLGPKEPADFSIKSSTLIILNEKGKELWRFNTGLENLCGEEKYRQHYQFKRLDHTSYLPYILIRDIDDDGSQEVLFSVQTQGETKEGEIFCFDRRGRLLWSFRGGRQIKYGDKTYSGDYRINGIVPEDLDADGDFEILVISAHRPDWPCQLALLDSEGKILGEFWNAGYLNDLACADLNADGVKEIIVGGNNNEYGQGCLAVLDAASMRGGSPQGNIAFQSPELEPGSELFYVLLSRTDVDLADCYPVDAVTTIVLLSNRRIQVKTDLTQIYYDFDFDFGSPQVILSNSFLQAHEKARLEGKVRSTLNKEYENNLIRGIRYWDGDKWTPEPTMNRRWRGVQAGIQAHQ
ncbi:MAG TPA: VCBS repeat-containing protein [Candidatus Desulfaltia sp.]|nr:VCBS repeat-containing protein [Candidatus Desulfaltia sp.]